MASIELIKSLNKSYGKKSPIANSEQQPIIKEAIDPNKIEKAISNSVASLGPIYTQYFDIGLPADVALLFIDVCSFSTRHSKLTGEEIGAFFDQYYDIVIPIIYKHGGEIDKIIGDGIICIFGPPFLDIDIRDCIRAADKCAKAIITATKGGDFSSKIAFHSGAINYFKNKSGLYKEFTMIGRPLTELFRLESISINDCINYYGNTEIRKYYRGLINQSSVNRTLAQGYSWVHEYHTIEQLKGVDFTNYYSIEYDHA